MARHNLSKDQEIVICNALAQRRDDLLGHIQEYESNPAMADDYQLHSTRHELEVLKGLQESDFPQP